jgi:hypothetical protein
MCASENGKCVTNYFECCGDLTIDVTKDNKIVKTPLVKCTNENKCVPENSEKYCFEPVDLDCKSVLGN